MNDYPDENLIAFPNDRNKLNILHQNKDKRINDKINKGEIQIQTPVSKNKDEYMIDTPVLGNKARERKERK